MPYKSNIKQVTTKLKQVPTKVATKIGARITRVLHTIDREVHARTPVWSGKAVRNMIWSKGSPNSREYDPIGTTNPGATNSMPLGPEPRRAANEAAARATLERISIKRPFGIYYLSNTAKHIGDLEHGLLPSPDHSRSPAGMFGVTYAIVTSKLRAGAL